MDTLPVSSIFSPAGDISKFTALASLMAAKKLSSSSPATRRSRTSLLVIVAVAGAFAVVGGRDGVVLPDEGADVDVR